MQKTMGLVRKSIEAGNLQRIKQLTTDGLVLVRDRGGRTLLHYAMIYERLFVIKFLLKTYPDLLHLKDNVSKLCLTIFKTIQKLSNVAAALNFCFYDPKTRYE